MENRNQTAVEWLVTELEKTDMGKNLLEQTYNKTLMNKAKVMENQQIIDAYIQGRKDNHLDYYPEKHAKETYDEMFKKDKP